jgi:hypothetical protein
VAHRAQRSGRARRRDGRRGSRRPAVLVSWGGGPTRLGNAVLPAGSTAALPGR